MNRAMRRKEKQLEWARKQIRIIDNAAKPEYKKACIIIENMMHDYDEDAVCIKCGFDGAEWFYLKSQGYDYKEPRCESQN